MTDFFRLLSRFPLGALQAAGALLGLAVYLLSPTYRARLVANLRSAGLPSRLRWRCAAQAGRMVGELPWVWFRPLGEVAARVRCDDLAVLDEAERAGRGVLFLTPHLGSFEVTARYYAARAPITVLFKPPRQPALAGLLAAARNAGAMRSAPTSMAGVRALLRALRAGEAVGLLPDQVPSAGEGIWSVFFGMPAYSMTLPQRLAASTGAAVVLAVGERLGPGRGWRLRLRLLDGAPPPLDLNQAMEAEIRRLPTQYLWGYNRFKRPAGAPAPDGSEAGPQARAGASDEPVPRPERTE